jgi:disulfide bond formation protein DsbB
LVALAGSLYLSLGMDLKACPLCFYQRTFVMGVVAVLCLGLLLPGVRTSALNVLALPLAVSGLAIAVFHVNLEATGVLECPTGMFGYGSAPQQSLTIYVLLVLLLALALIVDALRRPVDLLMGASAIVVGLLLALGSICSTPPSPEPKQAYNLPVDKDGCRKPFKGEQPPLRVGPRAVQ